MAIPKQVLDSRKTYLIKLFLDSGGLCVYGFSPCKGKRICVEKTVCAYGKVCDSPTIGNLCKFKPVENQPHLPCQTVNLHREYWRCAYGDYPCYNAKRLFDESTLTSGVKGDCFYPLYTKQLIREWSNADRAQSLAEWRAEAKALHSLGETRTPIRGQFNNISRDIYSSAQPLFFVETLGMNGLTLKPFAKVKLASSYLRLHIDLGDCLHKVNVSKNAKRKAIRYGKPLPKSVEERIAEKVSLAVRDYLK